jgi:hypothetical protein
VRPLLTRSLDPRKRQERPKNGKCARRTPHTYGTCKSPNARLLPRPQQLEDPEGQRFTGCYGNFVPGTVGNICERASQTIVQLCRQRADQRARKRLDYRQGMSAVGVGQLFERGSDSVDKVLESRGQLSAPYGASPSEQLTCLVMGVRELFDRSGSIT